MNRQPAFTHFAWSHRRTVPILQMMSAAGVSSVTVRPVPAPTRVCLPARPRLIASTCRPLNQPDWPQEASQLAAIVQQSNDAVFSRRLNGIITTWNAAAERIFGFTAKEIVGQSSRRLLPRGHGDEFRRLLAHIRRGEVIQHFETERLRKDRRHIFVSLTLSPVRNMEGQLVGFSTIARDITEERQAREALLRSERALADLFEEASVGLVWTTSTGQVLRVNQAMLEILECTATDSVAQPLAKFYTERSAVAALVKRLIRRGRVRNLQATLRAQSGQVREVLIDASAFWEKGKIVHLRWFVRDMTRRKQLEREVLAISEREKRSFSGELHDSLGQQLSGITYLNNVLRDRLRESGSPEAASAGRISMLLKQAIEQTRAVARGLSPVRPEPDGLGAALRELAAQGASVFGVDSRFHYPKQVLVHDSEAANHLYRIAQEAMQNAVRHGQAKRIVLGLTRTGKVIQLKIVDNGKGIGKSSPTKKGLGLRIMQYRAGLLQGTVSLRPGRRGGTEVCCVAPLTVPKPNQGPNNPT